MIEREKPENFTPRFQVVSCFVEWQDKILLLHRQEHKTQPNTWGVPAGKVEEGEERLQAMVRELREETGLNVPSSALDFLEKIFVSYPEYDFVYHIFRLQLKSKPEISLNEEEHQAYRWVEPESALDLDLIRDLDSCLGLIYDLGLD